MTPSTAMPKSSLLPMRSNSAIMLRSTPSVAASAAAAAVAGGRPDAIAGGRPDAVAGGRPDAAAVEAEGEESSVAPASAALPFFSRSAESRVIISRMRDRESPAAACPPPPPLYASAMAGSRARTANSGLRS